MVKNLTAQTQDIQERVFVHPNAQVFVSGETLRFSAYTLSHQTGKVSDLSKILYVQLIGEEGPVFEQKVQLENGRGSGEFFVNSLVPTGRYQLLAYTRWMRNFDDYFQLPITIINPFEADLPEFRNDSILEISFYHPNGYLIQGFDAQVGFRINWPAGGSAIREGKVIDAEGTIIQSFVPDNYGLGVFQFNPNLEHNYQVLLEDEMGNISFHDFMPIMNGGYDIQIESQEERFAFIPRAVNRSEEAFTLEVYYANSLWHSEPVYAEEVHGLRNSRLPSGVFQWVLKVAGEPVHSRTIIPSQRKKASMEIAGLDQAYGLRDSLNFGMELPEGDYSVSIHKQINEIEETEVRADQSRIWANMHDPLSNGMNTPRLRENPDLVAAIHEFQSPELIPDSIMFLPEIRNELVEVTLSSTAGKFVRDVEVALSFPGSDPQVKTGFTNDKGQVLFHHHSLSDSRVAYLSALDHEIGWQFEIEEKFLTEFPPFDYSLSAFDSLAAVEVKQRSIDNQLLNAFQDESIQDPENKEIFPPQFMQWNFQYALDDYERFPDFKEYFIEYIVGAGIKNGGIQIRKEYYHPEFRNRQLVLLDGVPVSPKRVLELDPYLVENVRVMMNRAYLGPSVFDGVVLIETYDSDLAEYVPLSATKVEYLGISPVSDAFSGPTTVEANNPDRRVHLYWDPAIRWNGGELRLNSITSDVTGRFEVRIEGFTVEGEPVSIQEFFQVER